MLKLIMTPSDNIQDYHYNLPQEKIALFPLEKRDASKLLVFNKGKIEHSAFHNISSHLPENAFLFFNNTKVIPARLHFTKETGASIEIFLLHPVDPSTLLAEVMQTNQPCTWQCTIGNLKRWSSRTHLTLPTRLGMLTASLEDRQQGLVRFQWTSNQTFAEIIEEAGNTPLPPYLKRDAITTDRQRYQTIYSYLEGAVAAPTAGLHFTPEVFESLVKKNIRHDFLTLHVSAGTFQPIKTDQITDHIMHQEQVIITRKNIDNLLKHHNTSIIAVGTTSMRTLESIYWYGVKLLQDEKAVFKIEQDDPYQQRAHHPSTIEAWQAIRSYMTRENIESLVGETSIFIRPGYTFKVCHGLITNFHQPGSTLILLIAAFIGESWKTIYQEALTHDYRFLSFGDSSLLIP